MSANSLIVSWKSEIFILASVESVHMDTSYECWLACMLHEPIDRLNWESLPLRSILSARFLIMLASALASSTCLHSSVFLTKTSLFCRALFSTLLLITIVSTFSQTCTFHLLWWNYGMHNVGLSILFFYHISLMINHILLVFRINIIM